MALLGSLLCLLCSFVTCFNACNAAPVLTCPNNRCLPSTNPLQVNLPLGAVVGASSSYGAQRFTLPYALPPVGELRFASPVPLTSFPSGSGGIYDSSKLPKACTQQPDARYGINEEGVSEDCLYLNIFRPTPGKASAGAKLPVLVWVHGGSFISGSSTAPGLDGSYLAAQHNVIVVTIQYRLGMFGWFSPSQSTDEAGSSLQKRTDDEVESLDRSKKLKRVHAREEALAEKGAQSAYNRFNSISRLPEQDTLGLYKRNSSNAGSRKTKRADDKLQGNQGLRDAILALQFVRNNIASFGGNPSSVTLAGQSSGAHLIRSLLNSAAASPLFARAILHSDPANFGTQTLATSNLVSTFALSQTNCSDLTCLRSMSAQDVLSASTAAVQAAQAIDAAVAVSEVWRPFAGSLTGAPFETNPETSSSAGKPIIFTNVENEAGSVIGSMLMPTPVGASSAQLIAYPVDMTREQLLEQMFNGGRAALLASAAAYGMSANVSLYTPPGPVQPFANSTDGLRRNLETILTQGMFTCATWSNAQRYAANPASSVYVALFEKGLTYPSNNGNDYCDQGRVCHEDDILLLFTDPNTINPDIGRVVTEVQARWTAFMRTGSPNSNSYRGWTSVGTSQQAARVMRSGIYEGKAQTSSPDTISLQQGQYAGCGTEWGGQVKFDWQLYG